MYCGQPDPLLDLNWNQTMDASGHYKSPPSSGISSSQPSSSADGMTFHKLMGGLQSIGNSGNGMPQPSHPLGVYLNSPPKLNLSMTGHFHQQQQQGLGVPMPLPHLDQFSGFDVRNDNRMATQFGGLDANKLSRVGRLQIGLPQGRNETLVAGGLQLGINNVELANGREEPSVSDPAASGEASFGHPIGSNAKKRRAPPKSKVKEGNIANSSIDPPKVLETEETSAKRSRSVEKNCNESDTVKPKIEQLDGCSSNGSGAQKQGKDSTVKAPEPPKDYIHVRARRGQATDNHSLAERVRREKISQRMKLLQDLVPGCNKVTGKAVMLDEIINYVQSLQRQVEFLSMKLAAVNPHSDFNNVANLLPKDMQQACGPMSNSVYSLETSEFTPPYINHPQHGTSLHDVLPNALENQSSMHLLDSAVHHNLNTHHSFMAGFGSAPSHVNVTIGGFWEDDLPNATHMDVGQN